MKIAAVVILYHPKKEVLENIRSYYDFAEKVYVFDNSETTSALRNDLIKLPKVNFHQNHINEGVAKRLNEGCNMAIKDGFDWVLTMDQDSSFGINAISTYLSCITNFKAKENVAIFGTKFSREEKKVIDGCKSAETEKLITSGSLVNLRVFERIGGFDNNLFIDAVDYDYCFRSLMADYLLIQFTNISITHTVGSEVRRASVKSLFLFKKTKEIHSPLRCYYMYRNMLYLKEKYREMDKKYFKQIKGYVLSRIKVSVFYGRETLLILKYVRAAKRDFKASRMGRIDKTL